ncbi:MAG: alpha/beta fold hydrolase [Stackebrandtia sp.]
MPFVSTTSAKVHYEIDGTGPALAMVHGVGGDAEKVFGPIVDSFAEHHTVIRPNLSGSGDTTDDGRQLTVEDLAEQVAAAIIDADAGPADLVGFSLGAVVAAAVAAEHPRLVRRLVLIGGWAHTTGPRDKFYFETWQRMLDADREVFKRFATLTGFSPAALDRFGHEGLAASLADAWPPEGIARQIDVAGRVDIRPLLPGITAETLVIALGLDHMVPPQGSRQLHEAIAESRLVELPHDGHMDWFAGPERIVHHISSFID